MGAVWMLIQVRTIGFNGLEADQNILMATLKRDS